MRLLRRALAWIGGVFLVWATARLWILGGSFIPYYVVACVFLLAGLLVEPLARLGRRREPF